MGIDLTKTDLGLKVSTAASMFRIIGVALPAGAILLWYVFYFPG